MERLIGWIEQRWPMLTVALLMLITTLSLWPVEQLPQGVPGSDKSHHLIAYMALVLPLALRQPRYWWWCVAVLFGWSGMIELIQPYVNRWGEWLDLFANGVGLLLGCTIGVMLKRYQHSAAKVR